MAGLPYESLPAQRRDPTSILKSYQDKEYDYLKSQYSNEAKALEQATMTDIDFKQRVNELNTKYTGLVNKFKLKSQQESQQLQQVQSLVSQGNISEVAGREAMWRMVLPQETEKAMFPAQEAQQTPYSMAQLMGAVSESITEHADAAGSDPAFWTRRSKEQNTRPGLLRAYAGWRELISYNQLNPVRQNQLDLMWDDYMKSDDRFDEWWVDDKKRKPISEVSASRPAGKIGRAMRNRINGSADYLATQTTPLGASVRRQVPSATFSPAQFGMSVTSPRPTKPKEKPKPSPDQLRRMATPEAHEQGVKLGYWTRQ